MSFMRIAVLLFVLTFCWTCFGRAADRVETVIAEGSILEIRGRSNITSFACEYTELISPDTLVHWVLLDDAVRVKQAHPIALGVRAFDCGNRFITRDLRRTLQSDSFPQMHLRLHQLDIADATPFFAQVYLSIVGVERLCTVTIEEVVRDETGLRVRGAGQIDLSAFSIRPVSSMWGLVRVDERIDIAFDLLIR